MPQQYASFSQRLLAQNIDFVLYLGVAYLLNLFINDDTAFYTLLAVCIFGYNVAFELSAWRGSIGKRMTGLEVDGAREGSPYLRIIIRNAMKFVSLLLLFAGFAMINFNRRRQSLHDKVSHSVVVFAQK